MDFITKPPDARVSHYDSDGSTSQPDLKHAVGYGPMHLCRFGDCEIWVADGGDHRCVLHSAEPWARTARALLVPRIERIVALVTAGTDTPNVWGLATAALRLSPEEWADG